MILWKLQYMPYHAMEQYVMQQFIYKEIRLV